MLCYHHVIVGSWSDWTAWGSCSDTCITGRTRSCDPADAACYGGTDFQQKSCTTFGCGTPEIQQNSDIHLQRVATDVTRLTVVQS